MFWCTLSGTLCLHPRQKMLNFAPEVVFLWTLKMWCVVTGIAQLNDLSQCSVQTSRFQSRRHAPKNPGGFLDRLTYKPGRNPGRKLKQVLMFYVTLLKKYFTILKDVNI